MTNPFFSIIIPSFNRAHIIRRAIDSILKQIFDDFEIIIVDDGSTDDTRIAIEKLSCEKIKYTYQENAGVCAARNNGVTLAKGEYLIFLDSDDWLSENYLNYYNEILTKKSYSLVLGTITYFNVSGNKIKDIYPVSLGTHYSHGLTGSFAIKRQVFNDMGGYDINLAYGENSDFFLRIQLDDKISMKDIHVCNGSGVCIIKEDLTDRRKRYNIKKYYSINYFLTKHEGFFRNSKKDFINFKRVLAFSALYNNLNKEALSALKSIITRYPFSFRTYFQYLFFSIPQLAKRYYYERRRSG
jgi:glycosyltransferase involved in cell wall biosynthesis